MAVRPSMQLMEIADHLGGADVETLRAVARAAAAAATDALVEVPDPPLGADEHPAVTTLSSIAGVLWAIGQEPTVADLVVLLRRAAECLPVVALESARLLHGQAV